MNCDLKEFNNVFNQQGDTPQQWFLEWFTQGLVPISYIRGKTVSYKVLLAMLTFAMNNESHPMSTPYMQEFRERLGHSGAIFHP
jgi:hypothetical protein